MKYIAKCTQCQRNKHSTYNKYGKMQVIRLFDVPWEEITMDFIIKLLKSKDPTMEIFYDSIMVVVDKLTKYFYFIFFKETFDAEQLRYFFIN